MTMKNQTNWDELRDNALADNTAQGIFKHLNELESNRGGMHTRWPWELLQNARDASTGTDRHLIASIEHKQGELVFRHNGRGFADREITHLIHHGSTKVETDEALGKFGSGFLTTHLLSPEIEISGQLDIGQPFKFRLKRDACSYGSLRDSMDESWKDFQRSLSSPHTEALPDNFTTQFRYPIGDISVDAVKKGIAMLKKCAPFVVAFNEVFSRINIKSPDETTSFEVTERAPLSQDGLQEITVSKNRNGNQEDKVYLLAKGEKTSVAVALEPKSKTLMPINNTPRLFLGFPLIGTENFSFPAVINSFEFTPTEHRDGVFLGQAANEANRENETVIEEACELLVDLVQFAAESDYRNVYELANVPAIREQKWLDRDWLQETLKYQFIEKVRQTPAVLNENGDTRAPEDATLPLAKTENGVKALWDLLDKTESFRDALPRRNEAVGWQVALKSWADVRKVEQMSFDEARDGVNLAKYIEEATHRDGDCGTIEDLQNLLREDIEAVEWLNRLHDFLNKDGLREEVSKYHIVPDQDGFLDKLSNLYRDQDIAEELKDIAVLLNWDIRQELRDTRLSSLDNEVGKGDWNGEYILGKILKDIRKRAEDDPDNDFAEASVRLFAWIVAQEKWDSLRDFPVFAKRNDSGELATFSLKRTEAGDDPFLAPVRAWTKNLQRYFELFPRRYILADDFFKAVSDSDVWQTLDEQGFLKRNVIITKDVHFGTFLPDEPLSEKSEHKTIEKVAVTNVAFFTAKDVGAIDRVRKSQRLARIFWRFLTEWLVVNDYEGLEVKEACCDCDKTHRYYQAEWLEPLVKRMWVPLGGDRCDRATAQSLANLLRDGEWELGSLKENPVAIKLLEAIGVTQFDLTREFVAENPKTRQELDNAFIDMLATADGDINYLNHARNYIEDLKIKKQRVHKNQHLGKLVEQLVRKSLESEGFTVKRKPIGSDFEIKPDSVEDEEEMGIELAREDQRWLVEVKATRGQEVRMTATQARKAVEQRDSFLLCVVPVGDVDPELDTVRDAMRFVEKIGNRVKRLCNDLDGLEDLRDNITADKSSGVQLEVLSGTTRFRVRSSVWENDGFPLEDLAERLR